MKLDYSTVHQKKIFEYDFCVVGAGISGIISASELKEKYPNKSVCVIESGNYSLNSPHNERLKDVYYSDLPIKYESREFAIGGSTNTWGGLTSHFEDIEFEPRDYLEITGWPISYEELIKYYRIVSNKYNFIDTTSINTAKNDLFAEFTKRPFYAYAHPINYGNYLDCNKIEVIYNAHATLIISKNSVVDKIKISNVTTQVNSFVKAKFFILSMGGIETIKLLLNSTSNDSLKLGCEKNNLGHYFMNHPKNEFGIVEIINHKKMKEHVGLIDNNILKYIGLSLPKKYQIENKLMNNYIRFEPIMPWNKDRLVYNFIQYTRKTKSIFNLFLSLYKNKKIEMLDYGETGDTDYEEELENRSFYRSLNNLFLYIYFRLFNKKPNVLRYNIRNYVEMEPRYKNRVMLSNEQDALGSFKVKINYSISERERKSTIELHQYLDKFLKKNKLGKVDSEFTEMAWPINTDASHHVGGTIMGSNPEHSFVTSTLRVHSMNNLYIASGSVMPTSGSHNPTFTIAALACMMIDKFHWGDH